LVVVPDAPPLAGFFVVVFVVEFVVDDESVDEEPVEPVDVDEPVVLLLFDEEPIESVEPVEPVPVVGVAVVGVVAAGVVAAGVVAAGVVVVDVVLLVSVIVPDVFCVSGVFGGSFSPPHATRPATHAPTIRAETFMRTPEFGGA
jgi:hypothetical protein